MVALDVRRAGLALAALAWWSCAAAGQSDSCAGATAIAGEGVFYYNNSGATTDGLVHGGCLFFGESQIVQDLWWRWTAHCDGVVTVRNCGQSVFDTKVAVYTPGAACPPDDQYLVVCGDDDCDLRRTSVSFVALAGQTYLIRLGNYPGMSAGAGAITIDCEGEQVVCGLEECQDPIDAQPSFFSTGTVFRVADNFTPAASGFVDGLCWWGFNINTNLGHVFRVSYYTSTGDRPGRIIASYTTGAGLAQVGPVLTGETQQGGFAEKEYSASHRPFPVEAGVEYWLEIVNIVATDWAWRQGAGGDQSCWQDAIPSDGYVQANQHPYDLAFCLSMRSGCAGDVDGDGLVNFADLNSILGAFNTVCP